VIAFVRGRVAAVGLDHAVVETGGVGLLVPCPPRALAGLRVGEEARLATSLVVREDSLTLYGFGSDDERALFEVLLGVSGIGPRLAMAMLAVLTPEEVRDAVAADDVATLTRVPGIGRKGAQRLILELRDRIAVPLGDGGPTSARAGLGDWSEQVTAALVGLGWGTRDAAAAIDAVRPAAGEMLDRDGRTDVAALLRVALRSLDRPS
jgi:holliday junction DNA helicase RuvA